MNYKSDTTKEEEEEWKRKFRKEIDESELIQTYFKDYSPASVEEFVKSYVRQKFNWYNNEDFYAEIQERKALKWINKAHEHLQIIQLKKLFDLQCLWRAEKIKLNDVEISKDFERWERDILNCPFIEAVTHEDILEYAGYLTQSTADLDHQEWELINCFPSYRQIIDYYEDNDDLQFPHWYTFHNAQHSKQHILHLPDKRGEKEEKYKQLYYTSKQEKRKKESIAETTTTEVKPIDERPMLDFFTNNFTEWFIETFGPKKTLVLYKNYMGINRHLIKETLSKRIDYYVDTLSKAKKKPAIETGNNWVEALQKTAVKYSNQQVVKVLYQAWDQYAVNRQSGIAFPVNYEELEAHNIRRNEAAETILEGRIANNEPADFNF